MTSDPMVSVIVPTLNSARVLGDCLASIRDQTYKHIETIVVDSFSSDSTVDIARGAGATVLQFGRRQSAPFARFFDTPLQQNYGVKFSAGEYIFLVDSDMTVTPRVVEECVRRSIQERVDALIVPEVSYGEGFWCRCKVLERSLYRGSDALESARFISRKAWEQLGGIDASVGGFYDWDLTDRLRKHGLKVARVTEVIFHFEGKLRLRWTMRKKYIYGKTAIPYLRKQGSKFSSRNFDRLFPIRESYLRQLPKIAQQPSLAVGLAIMKSCEFGAAAVGMMIGWFES